MAITMWAAHDARTGDRIGPWRFALNMAVKDVDEAVKKGTEAVVRTNELRG
jgi:hypothetical protein